MEKIRERALERLARQLGPNIKVIDVVGDDGSGQGSLMYMADYLVARSACEIVSKRGVYRKLDELFKNKRVQLNIDGRPSKAAELGPIYFEVLPIGASQAVVCVSPKEVATLQEMASKLKSSNSEEMHARTVDRALENNQELKLT